jgi:hypothetical protein
MIELTHAAGNLQLVLPDALAEDLGELRDQVQESILNVYYGRRKGRGNP